MPTFDEQHREDLGQMADSLLKNGAGPVEKLTAANTKMLLDGVVTHIECKRSQEAVVKKALGDLEKRLPVTIKGAVIRNVITAPPWLIIMGWLSYKAFVEK